MNDVTTTALHAALRGLSQRQRTIADNIANIETPGFLAGKVDFESSLRSAVRGRQIPAGHGRRRPGRWSRHGLNGNNVNLDEETISMVETGLRYQLAAQAMSSKFSLLRTAIGGRG